MVKLLLSLTISSFFFSCNNKTGVEVSAKTDTLKNTLCAYQVNDTGYQIGYLTRLVKDTFMLAQDTVKFSKDSTEFELTGKKKWIKDTIYIIDLKVSDTITNLPFKSILTGKDSTRQYFLAKAFILADCGKNMIDLFTSRKLKPFVEKKVTQ